MIHLRYIRLMSISVTLSALCCTALVTRPAAACYWDKDTLASEKRKFPNVFELITGRFKRNSKELYQWRITDRRQQLKETPDQLSLMDDLAVALDKTGAHDEAAQVMLRALELDPNRYETHANLGTIYIHSGKFRQGLKHIDRALEINPQAHFGREIIQRELVRYVLKRQADPHMKHERTRIKSSESNQDQETIEADATAHTKPASSSSASRFSLPLYRNRDKRRSHCSRALERVWSKFEQLKREKTLHAKGDVLSCPPLGHAFGFAAHLEAQKISFKDGIKGVLGMMKFSNHRHPILLEALGDLLLAHRSLGSMGRKDAKQLASRAYLSAALNTQGEVSQRYKAKALMALVGTQKKMSFMQLEEHFKREVARGDRFFKKHAQRQRRLIKRGQRPE